MGVGIKVAAVGTVMAMLATIPSYAFASDRGGNDTPTTSPSLTPAERSDTFIGIGASGGQQSKDARFIVSLEEGGTARERADIRTDARKAVTDAGGRLEDTTSASLNTFIVTLPDSEAVKELRQSDAVQHVSRDQEVTAYGSQSPVTWNLDRIDQAGGKLNGAFHYANTGEGVIIYVIDSGIRLDHVEFTGRILPGAFSIDDGRSVSDCNGHGTHVASTAAGTTYGVAKKASIVPVRVLDCEGKGTMADILVAFDWILSNHPSGTPGVINASLGGSLMSSMNTAVANMVEQNFVVVAAAGNANTDACTRSPGSAAAAITVASTDNTDTRSTFSNWGSCIDMFAPGSEILAGVHHSSIAADFMWGTSMAAPHVAGIAAGFRQRYPDQTATSITNLVQGAGTPGVVKDPKSSPNIMARAIFGAPDAPTSVMANSTAPDRATITWQAPVFDGGKIDQYAIYASKDGGAFLALSMGTGNAKRTFNAVNLTPKSTYTFRVHAMSSLGTSPASEVSNSLTMPDGPPTPVGPPIVKLSAKSKTSTVPVAPPTAKVASAPTITLVKDTGYRIQVNKLSAPKNSTIRISFQGASGKWNSLGSASVSKRQTSLLPPLKGTATGTYVLRITTKAKKNLFIRVNVI